MVLTVENSIPITAKLGEDTSVTITGTDFTSPATVEIVGVDTIDALSINVISNTQITCIIPGTLGDGDYDLKITIGSTVVTLEDGVIVINETYTDLVRLERFVGYNSELVKMVTYVWK